MWWSVRGMTTILGQYSFKEIQVDEKAIDIFLNVVAHSNSKHFLPHGTKQ